MALLIAAVLAWWEFGPTDPESLRAVTRHARAMRDSAWSRPAFVLLYGSLGTFGVPVTPLTLAAGVIFGAAVGAMLSWSGAVLAAAGGYLVARRVGSTAVRTLAGSRAERLEELSDKTRFLTLLRFLLIQVLPLSALNLAAGVARVPFWRYVAAAAVGVIPGSVIYAYFAAQIVAGAAGADSRSRTQLILASLLLLLVTFVPTIAHRLRRRARA